MPQRVVEGSKTEGAGGERSVKEVRRLQEDEHADGQVRRQRLHPECVGGERSSASVKEVRWLQAGESSELPAQTLDNTQ